MRGIKGKNVVFYSGGETTYDSSYQKFRKIEGWRNLDSMDSMSIYGFFCLLAALNGLTTNELPTVNYYYLPIIPLDIVHNCSIGQRVDNSIHLNLNSRLFSGLEKVGC